MIDQLKAILRQTLETMPDSKKLRNWEKSDLTGLIEPDSHEKIFLLDQMEERQEAERKQKESPLKLQMGSPLKTMAAAKKKRGKKLVSTT